MTDDTELIFVGGFLFALKVSLFCKEEGFHFEFVDFVLALDALELIFVFFQHADFDLHVFYFISEVVDYLLMGLLYGRAGLYAIANFRD